LGAPSPSPRPKMQSGVVYSIGERATELCIVSETRQALRSSLGPAQRDGELVISQDPGLEIGRDTKVRRVNVEMGSDGTRMRQTGMGIGDIDIGRWIASRKVQNATVLDSLESMYMYCTYYAPLVAGPLHGGQCCFVPRPSPSPGRPHRPAALLALAVPPSTTLDIYPPAPEQHVHAGLNSPQQPPSPAPNALQGVGPRLSHVNGCGDRAMQRPCMQGPKERVRKRHEPRALAGNALLLAQMPPASAPAHGNQSKLGRYHEVRRQR
jgi:hypothetical protein